MKYRKDTQCIPYGAKEISTKTHIKFDKKKNINKLIVLSYSIIKDTSYSDFVTKLISSIKPDTSYKVYVRITFYVNEYKSAGNQFGFKYDLNDYTNI
jgi:hypothetical protein